MLTRAAERDLDYWARKNRRVQQRVDLVMKDVLRSPHQGIGHPEPLRHLGQGMWSRRITSEHRLIYRHDDNQVVVHSCRNHY